MSSSPAPRHRRPTRRDRHSGAVPAVVAALLAATALVAALLIAPTAASAAGAHARTAAEKSMITAALRKMNSERAAHHLRPLKLNTDLSNAARLHDYRMAVARTMSHQLPHEAALGSRLSASGYSWHSAGENIGWTSPRTTARLLGIISAMYAEKAPNDGHRRNILGSGYTDAGVDVYGDTAHNRIWLTVDFGHH